MTTTNNVSQHFCRRQYLMVVFSPFMYCYERQCNASATTAIDAITQYEILEEFERIKREKKTAMIFITHDLGAISKVADRIMVMNSGQIVDQGDFHHILHHAKDPYTRLLVEKRMAVMDRYRDILKREERKPCLN